MTPADKDLAWIATRINEVDSLYIYFDLTQPEYTVIQRNHPTDYESVKREVLLSWRRKKGAEATLPNLVSVLAASEKYVDLIEEIIEHFNVMRKLIANYHLYRYKG